MNSSVRNNLFVLFATLLLIACGFQLRGVIEANFNSISISGGSSDFGKQLSKRFKQSGVKVFPADAEMAIEILSDGLQKNILSINSSGLVSEYELIYTVTYRVKNINSTEWSTPITLDLNRQYTFDNENIVAKELEEKRLVRGMKDELIRTMATQISLQKD